MNALESRKQLLLAESELNRGQLFQEWQVMAHGLCGLAHQAKIMVAWVSSVALLVAGFAALRRGGPVPGTAKPSWLRKILNGARVALTVWLAFRARGEQEEHK